MGIRSLEKEIEKLDSRREKLVEELEEAKRNAVLTCTSCYRKSKVSRWKFIQMRHYIEPHGPCLMSGGYSVNSETQRCYVVCPKCKEEHYVTQHPQKAKILKLIGTSVEEQISMPKRLFASVEERERR